MKDKLVLLAKEKGYYSFHTVNKEQGYGWFIELCLLQKWLRDVHNIHVIMVAGKTGFPNYDVCLIRNSNNYSWEDVDYTYELALETGLLEALKLINNETSTG